MTKGICEAGFSILPLKKLALGESGFMICAIPLHPCYFSKEKASFMCETSWDTNQFSLPSILTATLFPEKISKQLTAWTMIFRQFTLMILVADRVKIGMAIRTEIL